MIRRDFVTQALMSTFGVSVLINNDKPHHRGLTWMLDTFGEKAVNETIEKVRNGDMLDMKVLLKELRRNENKNKRYEVTRNRRELNRDTILYRGPALWGDLDYSFYKIVRNRSNRECAHFRLRRDIYLKGFCIPTGSKILVDLRNNIPITPMVEIVETKTGEKRLHIWSFKGEVRSNISSFSYNIIDNNKEDDLFIIQDNLEGY